MDNKHFCLPWQIELKIAHIVESQNSREMQAFFLDFSKLLRKGDENGLSENLCYEAPLFDNLIRRKNTDKVNFIAKNLLALRTKASSDIYSPLNK